MGARVNRRWATAWMLASLAAALLPSADLRAQDGGPGLTTPRRKPNADGNGGAGGGVKVLIVGDTNDPSIGRMIQVNIPWLTVTFGSVPGVKITTRTGDQVNAQNIISAIRELNVGPNDAVVYYHLGHGAYESGVDYTEDPSGGHFFQLRGGSLRRREAWQALKAKGARLTVLITDTCNVESPIEAAHIRPTGAPYGQRDSVMAHLLTNSSGEIDVSGSSRGQFGWFSTTTGGWWTEALVATTRPDVWPDGNPDWRTFLSRAGATLSDTYQERKKSIVEASAADDSVVAALLNQPDQRPQMFRASARTTR